VTYVYHLFSQRSRDVPPNQVLLIIIYPVDGPNTLSMFIPWEPRGVPTVSVNGGEHNTLSNGARSLLEQCIGDTAMSSVVQRGLAPGQTLPGVRGATKAALGAFHATLDERLPNSPAPAA